MAMSFDLGSGLGAVGNFVGGMMDRSAAKDVNIQNQYQAALNRKDQYEFAQSGIQWKAADAKAAGIHPVFALGGSTSSFSPISVGSTAPSGMASALGDMGQNLGRAVNSTMSASDRKEVADTLKRKTAQELERGDLENMVLKQRLASQSAQVTQGSKAPAMPSASGDPQAVPYILGQGDAVQMSPGWSIPEKRTQEARPHIYVGGRKWLTNPKSSIVKEQEDVLGDEGIAASAAKTAYWYDMLKYNIDQGNLTRSSIADFLKENADFWERNTRGTRKSIRKYLPHWTPDAIVRRP